METTIKVSAQREKSIEEWASEESKTGKFLMEGETITRIQVIRVNLVFLFIFLAAATANVLPVCGIFVMLAGWTAHKFVTNTPEWKKGGEA